MTVTPLDSKSIIPIEYNHVYDSKIAFTKYRENFDFGLTVSQYYFNQNPKDKKTNFNTQYTLTNLYPLSTIVELNIPHTTEAVSAFSTTIQHDGKYLKTDFTDTNAISSTFVDSSEFSKLSANFLFTFAVNSITAVGIPSIYETTNTEDRITISQDFNNITYYLSAGNASYTQAKWTSDSTKKGYFRYVIQDNKITITHPNTSGVRLCNNKDVLSLSARSNFTTAAHLSTSFFDITRNNLTKDFKYIPNNYSKYLSSFNPDSVTLNTSTTVEHISNNYFIYNNNYNFFQQSEKNKQISHADLFPLKNQATLGEYYAENNHFNAQPAYLNRVYEKIHAGTHQIDGYEKIGLSYNIGTYDIEFKSNKLTYFTTPDSLAPYTILNIADAKLENLGAIAGDNPLMSDKVFKRREVIKSNSFSDDPNPIYLCSWLSGNSIGETRWADRYYNPLVSDFDSALSGSAYHYVVSAAGAQTTETFDVSSNLTFEPNNDYIFYHVGEIDYQNLLGAYHTKYNVASATQYLNHKGIPTMVSKAKYDDEIKLDGTKFGRFKTDVTGDFSVNFWLKTTDFTLPFCWQILGNYFDDGFGVFNTDLVTPNIILPTINKKTNLKSKLLFLNNDFEIYDEIVVLDGIDEVNIKGIGRRDVFSNLFVLCDTPTERNIILVFDNNNNLINKIDKLKDVTAENSVVDDFEVGECKVHVLFNPVSAKNYFTYNTDNNHSTTVIPSPSANTKGNKGKIFNIDNSINILSVDSLNGFGNEVAYDENNVPFIIKQFSPNNIGANRNYVQKGIRGDNKERIISGLDKKSRVHGIVIDDENQLVVLHDNNVISILDNNRKFIRAREFCHLYNLPSMQSYIDLIYDFEAGVYKKYILLLQEYADGVRLSKLDFDLNIIQSKKLKGVDVIDLNLTKTITSYSYLRKIGASKNKIKAILKTKPKFSSTGSFEKRKTQISFDVTELNPGYNHFFVNVSLRKGYMELYVNGKLYQKTEFNAGKYALDDVLGTGSYIGAVSTPYYLTLANRLLQPKKYFVRNVSIKAFKLYNKTMNYFDIMAHYNYHLPNKSVIWSYPIGQRTYIDTIDKLMKFNYPEKISNKYQVEIQNTGIKDNKLNNKIKRRVAQELKKITPYYDEVKNIVIN